MPDAGSLGDYQLLHRLAVGGQGEVFLARQRGIAGFDRLAVVKRLLPDVLESEEHLALFLDEARISANLTHPNIVSIYELGEANGEYFLSMEYVAGQNLGRLLMRTSQARQRLPLDLAAFIVHELAVALEYAHHAADADGRPLAIVHRDISPSNALISYRGDVKLMDFGIAKAANRESVSRTGVLRGKFPYMSPEQVRGESVDARSDIFSLGVVLWETTLGRRLFKGASDVETLRLVGNAPIASPVEIDPAYPQALADVVMSALDRDLDRRTPRAGELAAGLRTWLGEQLADVPARLGALMRQQFAAESSEQDRIVRAAMTPNSAPTHSAPGLHTEQPTTPLRAPLPPTVAIAATEASVGKPTRRRRGLTVGLALAVAATATGAYALWNASSSGSMTPSTLDAEPAAAADAASPSTDAADATADPRVDAASIVLDASVLLLPARPAPSAQGNRDAGVHTSPVDAGGRADALPVAVEPPLDSQLPPRGTLAIAPQPDSELTIDGISYDGGSSFEREVNSGAHEIVITNLRTRKSYRVRADVRPGVRTKCRIDPDDTLRCR